MFKMYLKISQILILIYLTQFINAQDNFLVKSDNFEISEEEFKVRFELTPKVKTGSDINEEKTNFLLTLAAEKLWVSEILANGNYNKENLEQYLMNIERFYVRDAYFKDQIADKVVITNEEIQKEMEYYRSIFYFNFLYSDNKSEIDSLYSELNKGISIDSLLTNRDEFQEQLSPVQVEYSQMNIEMEEKLFSLNINEFTKPIEVDNEWVIYQLRDKKSKGLSNQEFNDAYQKSSSRLREKKTKALYEIFIKEFYKDKKGRAEENEFKLLANKLTEVIHKKKDKTDEEKIILYYEDILRINEDIEYSNLAKPLLFVGEKEISLKEFIHYLAFKNFEIEKSNLANLPFVLNNYIRKFIELEFLYLEAKVKGYDKLPAVQKELEFWRDNYLAQLYKNEITDSVKTDFEKNQNLNNDLVTEVKIVEAVTDDLESVNKILASIDSGNDFEITLKELNINLKTPQFNSDEYIPLVRTGSYKELISEMNIGEVIGPLNVSSGYSIIKLLDRREIKSDSLSQLLREQNLFNEMENVLEEKTARLAVKNNIKFNFDSLNKVRVTDVRMIVYRKFGFGGVLNAVPFINQFYEWKTIYDNIKELSL